MPGAQPSEPRSEGLSGDSGPHLSHFESHRKPTPTPGKFIRLRVEEITCSALQSAFSPNRLSGHVSPLTFNSLTLDELSEELDRRTKETQRLQEEVENATKVALRKFCCPYGISISPGQRSLNHNDPRSDFNILPTDHQTVTPPLVCGVDSLVQEVAQGQLSSPEKKVLENALDECLQQLSDLQLSETKDLPKQETFSFDKAIVNLQSKLNKVQTERDALSDLRLKDSRTHVDQMEKMLCMLEELQNIKRAADQKLQETEDEALVLNRKVKTLEQLMKETYSSLLFHENRRDNISITSPNIGTGSVQLSPAAKITEDSNETDTRQKKPFLSPQHRGSKECSGVEKQNQRMAELIANLGQEMAQLTDKLSSSNYSSVGLSAKLELVKELADKQTSLHQCQVSELESTLFSYKDKVCCLEQQLLRVQSQLVDAQRQRERSSRQAAELQSQLGEVKRCGEQQQCELQVEVKTLTRQLEEAREQLCRSGEDNSCLQALLDQKVQEAKKSQELLLEKNKELQLRQQETRQHLSWLEEARSRCQTLHVEGETLRLKLDDREKVLAMLRLQMENSTQMHSRTIDNLHQENSFLSNQLNQHKQEMQQLKADLDQKKSDLANAEHERRQLQVSVAEQSQRVQEETLEKQELTTQLELQLMQLLTLTKEHKELQRLHSCKNREHEGVVLRLQSRLRNTHDELDQVRSTLRTLEGADGHGLQVAMDMQKEITVRREQVDSLQGKIQHFEETVEKLYQEKRYQSLESQRQLQELTFVREEKKQLANELETLRSKDQQLRDRIGQLEAILHKMTESFADCQDFIQLQEQEFYRLKLQHALNLKELQGQNQHTALNVPPPDLDSPTPSAVAAPPSSQQAFDSQIKSARQQESPARELRPLARELRGEISENHRSHSDNGAAASCFHRRRSAPERAHRATFSNNKAKEVEAGSRLRRKTCGSEPRFLMTAELNGGINNQSPAISSPVKYTSSPRLLSLGRRSPVHSLLTSDPNN